MKSGFKMLMAMGAALLAAGRSGVNTEAFGVSSIVGSTSNGAYKPQGGSRPATSRVAKTNKQRCSHNAKVKRRRGNA